MPDSPRRGGENQPPVLRRRLSRAATDQEGMIATAGMDASRSRLARCVAVQGASGAIRLKRAKWDCCSQGVHDVGWRGVAVDDSSTHKTSADLFKLSPLCDQLLCGACVCNFLYHFFSPQRVSHCMAASGNSAHTVAESVVHRKILRGFLPLPQRQL